MKLNSIKKIIKYSSKGVDININGQLKHIKWSFKDISDPKYLVRYIECTMTDGLIISTGYGDCFYTKNSMFQAFNEAWERFNFLLMNGKIESNPKSSNGFAAGESIFSARKASANELIEREMVLNAWNNKTGFMDYNVTSVLVKVLTFLINKNSDWNFQYFRIKDQNNNETLFAYAFHKQHGIVTDSIYISSNKYKYFELKLLRSILKLIVINLNIVNKVKREPSFSRPIDHIIFYKSISNAQKLISHIKKSNDNQIIITKDINKIKNTIIFNGEIMPIVYFSWNENWQKLNWGLETLNGEVDCLHPIM